MRAGELRDLITIEKPEYGSPDELGERTVSWREHARCWASIRSLSGREIASLPQEWAEARWRISLRLLDADPVTPAMRVAWGSKRLNIVSVERDSRGRRLDLLCCEVL